MKLTLPSPEFVSRNLSDLVGRPFVAKKAAAPHVPKAAEKWAVARYGAPGGATSLYWLVDLPAAAGLGAALSLIPSGTAQSAAKEGKLSDALLENFSEVMNVGATTLKSPDGRVVLQEVLVPPRPTFADLSLWLTAGKIRLDLSTTLQGYDAGRMALLYVQP